MFFEQRKGRIFRYYGPATVLSIIGLFLVFGLYHLTAFETIDEHFWKFQRVEAYYQGWKNYWKTGNIERLKKTRINDKPGITLALVSGIALPLRDHPDWNRIRDNHITEKGLYTVYDASLTPAVNLSFRLPILLLCAALLPLLYWLANKTTGRQLTSVAFLSMTALSPILVGMSQIINPDALLWTFFTISFLAFAAFLQHHKNSFLVVSILFFGFSLLTKYTAGILLVLLPILFVARVLYGGEKVYQALSKETNRFIVAFVAVCLGGSIIFALGMPAVFAKYQYFLAGTLLSPALEFLWPYLFATLGLLVLDAAYARSAVFSYCIGWVRRFRVGLKRAVMMTCVVLVALPLLNVWLMGAKLIPLENLKENAYQDGVLTVPGMANDMGSPWYLLKFAALESHTMVFTTVPLTLFFVLSVWGTRVFSRKNGPHDWIIFSLSLFVVIYIAGAMMAHIFLNARYMIVLYPMLALIAAVGVTEITASTRRKQLFRRSAVIIGGIIAIHAATLLFARPFYLSYQNILLPKMYSISDSWGYGSYEAAQYLNSIPGIETMSIWSDRSTICQFVKAKCIAQRKIDLTKVQPDYFVFNRRGVIRHRFSWKDPALAKKDSAQYYADSEHTWEWAIFIGGRKENYVKVIRSLE